MPCIKYKEIRFSADRQAIVDNAVTLVRTYRARGYSLTLRQLYYQFVARDLLPQAWADPATGSTNNERSYKKLGDVIADARMAGLIDWTAIEDRTREVDGNNHWDHPSSIIKACGEQFMLDKWEGQQYRVEVWVEKDALEGVVGKASRAMDVQFFSCRGYASMTSLWEAGQRLKGYAEAGQTPVIIHLGDHDPSGIDMSRDIQERVALFMDEYSDDLQFQRLALNRDQIDEYNPPPNPAKVTDSRYSGYSAEHGDECWELDALEPSVIDDMIRAAIRQYRDDEQFEALADQEQFHRHDITLVAEHWNNGVAKALKKIKGAK